MFFLSSLLAGLQNFGFSYGQAAENDFEKKSRFHRENVDLKKLFWLSVASLEWS
jgi:hypothetical protein